MKAEFTAVYEKKDKWYVAYIEELPGVNTQGKTLKEARSNLKEAMELILSANRELSMKQHISDERIKEPIFVGIGK